MGGEGCEHICMDVCPNIKIGDKTIKIKDNGKTNINPVSCGCCEICVRTCPYSAIKIVGKKVKL
ncbi:MAG: hypothetical protein PHY59_02290 [Methanobacterium sp.]|nr:hypothetical protein [Methanobacterium sp.]